MELEFKCEYYWQERVFELVDTPEKLEQVWTLYYQEPSLRKEVTSKDYADKMEDKWKRVYNNYTKRT